MLQIMKPDEIGEQNIFNGSISNSMLGVLLKGTNYTGKAAWKVVRFDSDNDVFWFKTKKDAIEHINSWWGAP